MGDTSRIYGEATEPIPFGAHVLRGGGRVRLAAPEIANGTAAVRPLQAGESPLYKMGQRVGVIPCVGLGERDLHAMANGPLMEPCKLFLPAGRLTKAEYEKCVADDFARAGLRKDGQPLYVEQTVTDSWACGAELSVGAPDLGADGAANALQKAEDGS